MDEKYIERELQRIDKELEKVRLVVFGNGAEGIVTKIAELQLEVNNLKKSIEEIKENERQIYTMQKQLYSISTIVYKILLPVLTAGVLASIALHFI